MSDSYSYFAQTTNIYLKGKIVKGEIKKTIALNDNIILDFNKEGRLVGIEILSASTIVPKKTLPHKIMEVEA